MKGGPIDIHRNERQNDAVWFNVKLIHSNEKT